MKFLAILPFATAVMAAGTLNVNLFSIGNTACSGSPVQTFKIGNTEQCHNAGQQFNSLTTTDIDQSFFGRNLRVRAFAGRDCTGAFSQATLTNDPRCSTQEGLSFLVGVAV